MQRRFRETWVSHAKAQKHKSKRVVKDVEGDMVNCAGSPLRQPGPKPGPVPNTSCVT